MEYLIQTSITFGELLSLDDIFEVDVINETPNNGNAIGCCPVFNGFSEGCCPKK